MKRHRKLFSAAVLMIVLCMTATAQTSASSTPASGSPAVSDEQLITQLVDEVKSGRELIEAQAGQIRALERQLAAEKANGASLTTSYAGAEREIAQLRSSVALLEKAIALHEQSIAILTADNSRLKGEAKKSRKRAAVATVVAIGSVALRVFGL